MWYKLLHNGATDSVPPTYKALHAPHQRSEEHGTVFDSLSTGRPRTARTEENRALRMPSSGIWRRVDLVWTDVSEEQIASIFRVEKSASCSHLLTLVLRSRIFLPWRWRRYDPPKRRFNPLHLHGATPQKTTFLICVYFVLENSRHSVPVRHHYLSPQTWCHTPLQSREFAFLYCTGKYTFCFIHVMALLHHIFGKNSSLSGSASI
jgi:hypothetical protein